MVLVSKFGAAGLKNSKSTRRDLHFYKAASKSDKIWMVSCTFNVFSMVFANILKSRRDFCIFGGFVCIWASCIADGTFQTLFFHIVSFDIVSLMVAIANIDQIISIIKKSKDPKIAAKELCKKVWKSGPVEAILKKVGSDACKPKGLSKDLGLKGKK